jgi:hypothetical protein
MREEANFAKEIVFVSMAVGDPWGGREELWSRTALYLLAEGFTVSAILLSWSPPTRAWQILLGREIEICKNLQLLKE